MRPWLLFLLSLSTCTAQAAPGAWVGVCEGGPTTAPRRLLAEYTSPNGARTELVVGAVPPPNCTAAEVPFPPEDVEAARLVPPAIAAAIAPGFVLTGRITEERFRVRAIEPRARRASTTTIPASVELSDVLAPNSFGAEDRAVALRKNGRITLDCRAGTQSAGMVLRMPYLGLPRAIPLTASVGYAATGEFEWGLSDATRAARGNPLRLAALPAASATSLVDLPTSELDAASVESVTIVCPRERARLELHSFRIEPKPASARARSPSRALWAWQADAWIHSPGALLEKLARSGADTLFTTVPVDIDAGTVAHVRALEAFVKAARVRGVRVWAVVGHPRAVIEGERDAFVRLPTAYSRYNREVSAEARLAGIQVDVEPYLNSGYALDTRAWHEAYVTMMERFKSASELPVDAALPYWWADRQTLRGPLMERLGAVVDSVTVMNYRTAPVQIKRIAQSFLEWGARHARSVRIALESRSLPDWVQRHYLADQTGEAALVAVGTQLVMLEFHRVLSFPELKTFRRTQVARVPSGTATFSGKRDALLALLPELEELWSAWPTFAGTALHAFEP